MKAIPSGHDIRAKAPPWRQPGGAACFAMLKGKVQQEMHSVDFRRRQAHTCNEGLKSIYNFNVKIKAALQLPPPLLPLPPVHQPAGAGIRCGAHASAHRGTPRCSTAPQRSRGSVADGGGAAHT